MDGREPARVGSRKGRGVFTIIFHREQINELSFRHRDNFGERTKWFLAGIVRRALNGRRVGRLDPLAGRLTPGCGGILVPPSFALDMVSTRYTLKVSASEKERFVCREWGKLG